MHDWKPGRPMVLLRTLSLTSLTAREWKLALAQWFGTKYSIMVPSCPEPRLTGLKERGP
jgi:hypothetical protein